MKVLNVAVHNVLGVKDVNFDLAGHHLFLIGGKNDQGKTSALTALLMALCGKRDLDTYPDIALRDGQDEGTVRVEIDGELAPGELEVPEQGKFSKLIVELLLKRKRSGQVIEEFRVLNADGDESPEPRGLLKSLYDFKGFDPLSFERLDRKAKKALLQKALGLDFTESDALHKKKYDDRTALNRQIKSLEAKYDKMPTHNGVPKAEVSVTDLMQEEEKLRAHNDVNRKHRELATQLSSRALAAEEHCSKADALVRDLEQKLDEARQKLQTARNTVAEAREAKQRQADVCKVLVDADTSGIRQQIAESGEINRKVRANLDKAETKRDLDALDAQKAALEKSMEEIKEEQQKQLLAAEWPVEGMGLDEEGLLYNGLPFEQANKATRIRTSVLIGMKLNPKLKLLVCQGGGDCDEDTLAQLEQMLVENDFQLLLELVTRGAEDEARCAVIMRDGEVAAIPADGELIPKAA